MADERLEIVGVAQEASIQVAPQVRLPATVAQKPTPGELDQAPAATAAIGRFWKATLTLMSLLWRSYLVT